MAQMQTVEDVIAQLDLITERPGFQSAGVLVSAALTPGDTAAMPISVRAMYCGSTQQARSRAEYGSVCLVEEWLPGRRIVSWLERALRGHLVVDGLQARTSFSGACADYVTTTKWSRTGWSEFFIRCTVRAEALQLGNGPVIRAGLPPYQDVATAANDWVFGLQPSQPINSIVHDRELAVLVPDMRARVLSGQWRRSQLTVNVETRHGSQLELQAIFVGSRIERERRVAVSQQSIHIDVPVDARGVRVFLVTGDSLLSDVEFTRREPAFGLEKERQLASVQATQDLDAGEGQFVEFKPFVRKADAKETEFVETVIAFANSGGGRLYVGVTDRGEVQGDAELRKCSGCGSRDEGLKAVLGRLDELLTERLKSHPPIEKSSIELNGGTIVVVNVGAATRLPCSTHGNDIFVRTGATNRRPETEYELRRLLSPRNP